MADGPAARDDDRLPWLEPVGEAQRARARKPVSRTALVGLLVAFFGIGLALAFSLGYRFGETDYRIAVVRTSDAGAAEMRTTLDGTPLAEPGIPLVNDQREHVAEVRINGPARRA